jgi:hypothetical protein
VRELREYERVQLGPMPVEDTLGPCLGG